MVFAGKAHPADDLGKEMIAQIVRFSRDPSVRHRITFIEDYDISVARIMYQGSDVWLNTPRRPMEASGTSGEKAALNGALNCSILDGWWDEMFDGNNGWAISSAEASRTSTIATRWRPTASSSCSSARSSRCSMTEGRAVPPGLGNPRQGVVAVARPESDGIPHGPGLPHQMYEPIAAESDALAEDHHARARALAAWKQRVTARLAEVTVDVDPEPEAGLRSSARSGRYAPRCTWGR